MAWKIFNIGSANKRIDELEAENAALKQQVKAAEEATPEAVAHLQGELSTATESLGKSAGELKAAQERVAALEAEKAELAGKVTKLTADLETKGKEVEIKAAAKAAEIQASIGAPPAPAAPASATAKPAKEIVGLSRAIAATREQIAPLLSAKSN